MQADLPVTAVLGLNDQGNDWARLRGLQYADLARSSKARIAIQAVAGAVAATLFLESIGVAPILTWLVALAASLFFGARIDASLIDADRRSLSHAEVKAQTLSAIGNALVWVVPLAVFGNFSEADSALELWTVIAMLMAVSAMILPSVPLGTIMFTGIVGLAASAGFAWSGNWVMTLASFAFVVTVCGGAIANARRHLAMKLIESAMIEKDEVVSLLLREFEEGEADWLWEIDTSRRVTGVSPRFAYALGQDQRNVEGKPLIQLIAGPAWETGQFPSSLHDLAERLKRRESFSNLLVRVTIGGRHRWWELSGTPRLDDRGVFEGFRGVGSDVTEQRESSDKIAYLARYDTLTGLPNRMMLTDALSEALSHAEQWRTRCAFLMIDLDRFKAVNDTLGHLVGDQLLAMVSQRLQEQMTDSELCGRLGGDEFAIVVRDATDPEHVEQVARRVIKRLSQPYEIDHHTLYVGASIGSAIGPRDGSTVEALMHNADLALYRSKDSGGGIHCSYEPALHAHAEERRKLEFALRRALDRNEFSLAFHPVTDAESGAIVSFEALLRWDNEEYGQVSPAKFVPLAEDTRLIVPIGEWVLREACKEAMRWPGHVKVAINVSGEQLLDSNFAATVVGALSQSGLPASRLELEVTEHIFLRDDNMARATLEKMMALGCAVALDDFGTGQSSLGYLRRMRFSTIKIDRSFVHGAAADNPESLAIIRAVVAMADSLEMSTTAEGVETAEELAAVRKLGCRKVQGHYFGWPMAPDDVLQVFGEPPARNSHAVA